MTNRTQRVKHASQWDACSARLDGSFTAPTRSAEAAARVATDVSCAPHTDEPDPRYIAFMSSRRIVDKKCTSALDRPKCLTLAALIAMYSFAAAGQSAGGGGDAVPETGTPFIADTHFVLLTPLGGDRAAKPSPALPGKG